jgi:hypothetical protein
MIVLELLISIGLLVTHGLVGYGCYKLGKFIEKDSK